jgi:hypothetical protein
MYATFPANLMNLLICKLSSLQSLALSYIQIYSSALRSHWSQNCVISLGQKWVSRQYETRSRIYKFLSLCYVDGIRKEMILNWTTLSFPRILTALNFVILLILICYCPFQIIGLFFLLVMRHEPVSLLILLGQYPYCLIINFLCFL